MNSSLGANLAEHSVTVRYCKGCVFSQVQCETVYLLEVFRGVHLVARLTVVTFCSALVRLNSVCGASSRGKNTTSRDHLNLSQSSTFTNLDLDSASSPLSESHRNHGATMAPPSAPPTGVQITEVKGNSRENRTATHSHIKGLGLRADGTAQPANTSGFIGQEDAREVR